MFQIKQFSSKFEGKYYCYVTNDVNEVITQRSHVMVKIRCRALLIVVEIEKFLEFHNICFICICISMQMVHPREKAIAKVALIIANDDYESHKRLETPRNDAAKIGGLLKEIGFRVICLANLSLEQIRNATRVFSEALTEGVYGTTSLQILLHATTTRLLKT